MCQVTESNDEIKPCLIFISIGKGSGNNGRVQHQCKPHLVRENGESKVTKAGIAPQVPQRQKLKRTSSDPHRGASGVPPHRRRRHARKPAEAEAGKGSATVTTAAGYAPTWPLQTWVYWCPGNGRFQLPPLREQAAWYFLPVSVRTIRALQREEGRQRMADLRHARRSRRAALAFERRYALTYGAKGRITNLRRMVQAMAH